MSSLIKARQFLKNSEGLAIPHVCWIWSFFKLLCVTFLRGSNRFRCQVEFHYPNCHISSAIPFVVPGYIGDFDIVWVNILPCGPGPIFKGVAVTCLNMGHQDSNPTSNGRQSDMPYFTRHQVAINRILLHRKLQPVTKYCRSNVNNYKIGVCLNPN